MRRLGSALGAAAACVVAAQAQTPTPFAPQTAPETPVMKILAPAHSFDPAVFAAFERANGVSVLVDAIDAAAGARPRVSGYDLMLLPTAELARAMERSELKELDRARLARLRSPIGDVAKKFAAYGAAARFALPYDWGAVGIAYDHDRVIERIGAAPTWGSLFQPDAQRLLLDCGLALPDDRDALFFGAWKALGVEPAAAQPINVAPAAFFVARARKVARVFGAGDLGGVFAGGGACIGVASYASVAAARARTPKASGIDIQFAIPKEGAAIAFDALAIPKDAAHPDASYALVEFLVRPENSARNARYSGAFDAFDAKAPLTPGGLAPIGLIDAKVAALVEAAWASARVSDPPQLPPARPRGPVPH